MENVENVEDVVIEEIMKECCGEATWEDLHTKFLKNLEYLYNTIKIKEKQEEEEEKQEENKKEIIETIKKRITLKGKITKEDFISFLKQKIGIEEKKEEEKKEEEKKEEEKKEEEKKEEEKKEEEKKNEEQKNEPKKEKEGCPCCNC